MDNAFLPIIAAGLLATAALLLPANASAATVYNVGIVAPGPATLLLLGTGLLGLGDAIRRRVFRS